MPTIDRAPGPPGITVRRDFLERPWGTATILQYSMDGSSGDPLLLFLPALSTDHRIYEPVMRVLAAAGYRVVFVTQPRGLWRMPGDDDLVTKKSTVLLDCLGHVGAERIEAVVGHSEGCLSGAIAMRSRPELFRRVVFAAPAGVIPQPTYWSLFVAFAREVGQQAVLSAGSSWMEWQSLLAAWKVTAAIVLRPLEVWHEIRSIKRARLVDILPALRAAGHRIAILHGERDSIFDWRHSQAIAEPDIDLFLLVPGTHNTIYLAPVTYTRYITDAFDRMQGKSTLSD